VEALESATKRFEDLEFRQLERESGIEEEKETVSRQLLQEKAEYHRSVAKRKVNDTDLRSVLLRTHILSFEWQVLYQTGMTNEVGFR